MIGAIETAMLATLRAASDAQAFGFPLRAVAPYAGQLEDAIDAVQLPAVYVYLAGCGAAKEIDRARGIYRIPATWSVVVAQQNRRDQSSARTGDGREPGSYDLITGVIAALAGQSFELPIRELAPGAVRLARQSLGVSVYEIEFATDFDIEPLVWSAPLDEFLTFHADVDIEPFGNVVPPLPAADPDAEILTVIRES